MVLTWAQGPFLVSTPPSAPAMLAPLQSHIKAVLKSKNKAPARACRMGGGSRVKRGSQAGIVSAPLRVLHFPQKGREERG